MTTSHSLVDELLPNLAVMLERNLRNKAPEAISNPEAGRVVSYEIGICDVNDQGLFVTEDCCDYDDQPGYRTVSKFRIVRKTVSTKTGESYDGCPFRCFIDGKIKSVDDNGVWLEGGSFPAKHVYPRIKTW